jgi:hypothetical protein
MPAVGESKRWYPRRDLGVGAGAKAAAAAILWDVLAILAGLRCQPSKGWRFAYE